MNHRYGKRLARQKLRARSMRSLLPEYLFGGNFRLKSSNLILDHLHRDLNNGKRRLDAGSRQDLLDRGQHEPLIF